MKTVGNNEFVSHKWTVGAYARSGNMSCENYIAFSYGTAIGRIIDNPRAKGGKVYFLSEEKYSCTTARHLSILWRAIPFVGDGHTFHVPVVGKWHSDADQIKLAYDYLADNCKEAWQKIQQANKRNKYSKLQDYISCFETLTRFCNLFTDYKAELSTTQEDLDDRLEVYKRNYEESERKSIELYGERQQKKAEAEERLQERIRAAFAEQKPELEKQYLAKLQDWRDKKISSYDLQRAGRGKVFVGTKEHSVDLADRYDLLRTNLVNGKAIVETNRNASVSLDEARQACKYLTSTWKAIDSSGMNEIFSPSVTGNIVKAGPFTINNITQEDCTIGCHKFKRSEVENLFEILGEM